MNTKEIIDGLEEINYSLPHSLIPDKAIELIESLQAEVLAAKDAARAAQDANSEAGNTITQLQAEKWDVMAQLAEAKRRADKTVKDLMLECIECIAEIRAEEGDAE